MKKTFVIFPALFLVAAIAVPHLVAASSSTTVTLYNPLGENDIRVVLGTVIKGLLSIIGSLALLMFVYGGTLWLTSAGNPERIKKGKDILVWAVAGLGIIFSAYAVVNAVINAVTTGSVTAT